VFEIGRRWLRPPIVRDESSRLFLGGALQQTPPLRRPSSMVGQFSLEVKMQDEPGPLPGACRCRLQNRQKCGRFILALTLGVRGTTWMCEWAGSSSSGIRKTDIEAFHLKRGRDTLSDFADHVPHHSLPAHPGHGMRLRGDVARPRYWQGVNRLSCGAATTNSVMIYASSGDIGQ